MFFSLILENEAGDQINMTSTANQYMTSKIEGLVACGNGKIHPRKAQRR